MKHLIYRLKRKLKAMSNVLRSDQCIVITHHVDNWRIHIQCSEEELARFTPGVARIRKDLNDAVEEAEEIINSGL